MFVSNHCSVVRRRGGEGREDSQGEQAEDPDTQLSSQEVPGAGSPVGGGAGL